MDFRNRDRHDAAKLHMRLINLQDGEAQIVSDLVAAGGRLDVYGDIDGMTPFQHAAKNGQAKVVRAMIDAGSGLHGAGGVKATALHLAAENGHVEVCRVLLDAGTNPRPLDGKKRTPMIAAAQAGHGDVVHLFLGHPKVKESQQELTEVLKALAATSEPKYLQEVLERLGATADRVTETFWDAVKGGNLAVAKHLVEQGADWRNAPCGRTALQLAKRDAQDLKRYLRALRTEATLEGAMAGSPDMPSIGQSSGGLTL